MVYLTVFLINRADLFWSEFVLVDTASIQRRSRRLQRVESYTTKKEKNKTTAKIIYLIMLISKSSC